MCNGVKRIVFRVHGAEAAAAVNLWWFRSNAFADYIPVSTVTRLYARYTRTRRSLTTFVGSCAADKYTQLRLSNRRIAINQHNI